MNRRRKNAASSLDGERQWYKDAIIYEVPVRAFRDSNGDGVGDFRGLVEKLDYLQDLGVTALWLLPFYPSPLRDDGYDIADYLDIHPRYGTLADFKLFLREAHRRGLRVITELVVNHTSDQHPWFQRARRAPPGDPHRDFYVWSDTAERYREARIIFKDFESSNWTRDPVANAYYWHRFYSHQPDLNYDNPAVQEAVLEVLDYWLEIGVDGLRLDAVPYLYEREGTNCENLPETHVFLKKLRKHIDEKFPGRMLLAEANQWPEDAVAYFGQGEGDECHMAFHFPVMPRLFMGIHMEDRLPIFDILQQTPPIPATCQWALFLRNHDELTLEMVTDEDRDYMYRVYARDPQARINLGIRRRLAPLLENHRSRIELMNGLLFSLPGTPVLYYGDEIGMGDNIYLGDRNGVRTPMQWTAERNAGFSSANPQGLYLPLIIDPEYHFEAINVEMQQSNTHSLLWWTKRLIDLRKRHPAFGRGSITFLTPDNHKVLAFIRSYSPMVAGEKQNAPSPDTNHAPLATKDDDILVVANLSRTPQYVELNLGAFAERTPVELTGHTAFPPITDRPYFLTLGSYAFHWFALEKRSIPTAEIVKSSEVPTLEVSGRWDHVFLGDVKDALQEWLSFYLQSCPWFVAGQDHQTEAAMILETIPVPSGEDIVHIALVQVEYSKGDSETYVLPLAFATGSNSEQLLIHRPSALVCKLRVQGLDSRFEDGILYDPSGESTFAMSLLEIMLRHRRFRRTGGELHAFSYSHEHLVVAGSARHHNGGSRARETVTIPNVEPALLRGEQRNTSIVYSNHYLLKLFRRIEEGIHPEVEVGRFLAEKTDFHHTAYVAGSLEYRRGWGEPITLGILHEFVPHQGDGWRYCQDALDLYFERAKARPERGDELPLPNLSLLTLAAEPVPPLAEELIGPVLEAVRVLGQRTGELHRALASRTDDPSFAPEPFTTLYQRSLYQSLRSQVRQTFAFLRRQNGHLPDALRDDIELLTGREEELLQRIRKVYQQPITAWRIRIHGDYNLREVLYDGRDFTMVDFEGDIGRPLNERRRKYSPMRDVAGMLRSFHYATRLALNDGTVRQEDRPTLDPWARLWQVWASAAFLRAYLTATANSEFLPASATERETLLDFYLIKRAVNEFRAELGRARANDASTAAVRIAVPVQGLLQLLNTPS